MNVTTHSRLPWHVEAVEGDSVWVLAADGVRLAAYWPERRADAEFIVRAVNNFDALLCALKDTIGLLQTYKAARDSQAVSKARAVIVKAEAHAHV